MHNGQNTRCASLFYWKGDVIFLRGGESVIRFLIKADGGYAFVLADADFVFSSKPAEGCQHFYQVKPGFFL